MDSQKSQAKLTRNHTSVIRSSPTIRSSIQSLSSVSEITDDQEIEDVEEQKPHGKPCSPPVRPCSSSGSGCLTPVLTVLLLSMYTFIAFLYRDSVPVSENLLLVLICLAIILFLVSKKIGLIRRNLARCKTLCDEYSHKVRIASFFSKNQAKPVQWFIGEPRCGETDLEHGEKESCERIMSEGVEFYSNGDFYEGEFHRGKSNGSGVYNYFVNGRYEGDWIDGRYDGYGVESWAKGSRYKGQYQLGLRHGFGAYKFYTGDAYAGEWCNGQSNGVGEQICADGSSYIGEFKSGAKHGLGRYHFRNGDTYAGEYFSDKVHGFGVYHFVNGHCYEGSWHDGRKQGYGMYTFRNSDTKCGEWDNGSLKIPLPPMNESVLRAVEASRKAADTAIHIQRVDEQVNRAVIAANRAATAARVAAVKAVQNRIDGHFCRN